MSGAVQKASAVAPSAVLPPGCNGDGTMAPAGQRGRTGCRFHYPPGRNLAAEGCICPAWFDSGGWHVIEWNHECAAHVPQELADARGRLAAPAVREAQGGGQ